MKILEKKASRPVIPIISLIDILAILLIFFIVTTTFKEKRALLNIDLPRGSSLPSTQSIEKRLSVSVTPEGRIFLGGEEIPLADLPPRLVELKLAKPELKLELEADTTTPLGLLVSVWDALTAAGFEIKEVPARILLEAGGAGGE